MPFREVGISGNPPQSKSTKDIQTFFRIEFLASTNLFLIDAGISETAGSSEYQVQPSGFGVILLSLRVALGIQSYFTPLLSLLSSARN